MSKKLIKKWSLIILLLGVVFIGLGAKCPFKGEDGDDGATGSSGLISTNSYFFTATSNPYAEAIAEIDAVGVEAGWQAVTVWVLISSLWVEQPVTVGDGTTFEVDYISGVGDGGVQVEVFENAVYNEPPVVGYQDYMVTVQTFKH